MPDSQKLFITLRTQRRKTAGPTQPHAVTKFVKWTPEIRVRLTIIYFLKIRENSILVPKHVRVGT